MKSAPLGLAGGQEWSLATEALPVDGDRMTALIHYERQRWKKVNFFAKKLLPRSLSTCSNPVHAQFHWLAYTRNSRPCDVVCLQVAVETLRPIAGMIAPRKDLCDRSRSRWNLILMKHFRQTARGCLTAPLDRRSRRSNGHCSRRSFLHLVMTGHNARWPRTGRERGLWWRLSEASYLTVWTLNDRFFASLVHCMLRRVLSKYWRKETEKSKVFLWGGRFGRSLLCPGRAEKETRGSWPTTGCLPVDRNKLGPDSWRDEKGVWYRTVTHTHGIKAPWTARSPALARTWPPARIIKF